MLSTASIWADFLEADPQRSPPSVTSRRKSEPIFYPPMSASQLQKLLGGTPLLRQARPAIDDLDTVLAWAVAFTLRAVRPVSPRPSRGRDSHPDQDW